MKKFFKSRTIWTLLILIGFNILEVYGNYLSAETTALINGILSVFAIYFRIDAKVPIKEDE